MKGHLEVIEERKTCYRCKRNKPLSQFYMNRSTKDGVSSECCSCNKEKCLAWYNKNKQIVLDRNRKRRDKNRKLWFEYLKAHPCVDCGEDDPIVLTADHLRDKTHNIYKLVSSYGWDAVLKELEKCEIVCANCHFRRTAKAQGWFKNG